jgi:hypothetical protein
MPCDCGRCYIGETRRPSEVRVKEHRHNLTQVLLEKSQLTQHAYEEGHKIQYVGKKGKVLQIEPNTTYRKYKESTYMSLVDHPISQRSLDLSQCVFILMPCREFVSVVMTSDGTLILTTALK